MKAICLLVSSVIFLIVLNGCEVCSCKKIPCPAFNDPEFSNWFSYTPNQRIVFRNNALTDTITIGYLEKSSNYDARKGCYNGDIGCSMDYQISSSETQPDYTRKFSVYFVAHTPFESSSTAKNIDLRFYQFACRASGVNNQGLLIEPGIYSSQYRASLNIAGNTYNNVQVIIKDTSGSNNKIAGPYKIYLAQNQGMIGFEHYPSLQTWIRE